MYQSGIQVLKLYLDITREVQAERLEDRRQNPLKQWKVSPVDLLAQDHELRHAQLSALFGVALLAGVVQKAGPLGIMQ